MMRAHRAWHLRIWLLLAPTLIAGLATAISMRVNAAAHLSSAALPECCRSSCAAAEFDR